MPKVASAGCLQVKGGQNTYSVLSPLFLGGRGQGGAGGGDDLLQEEFIRERVSVNRKNYNFFLNS